MEAEVLAGWHVAARLRRVAITLPDAGGLGGAGLVKGTLVETDAFWLRQPSFTVRVRDEGAATWLEWREAVPVGEGVFSVTGSPRSVAA